VSAMSYKFRNECIWKRVIIEVLKDYIYISLKTILSRLRFKISIQSLDKVHGVCLHKFRNYLALLVLRLQIQEPSGSVT